MFGEAISKELSDELKGKLEGVGSDKEITGALQGVGGADLFGTKKPSEGIEPTSAQLGDADPSCVKAFKCCKAFLEVTQNPEAEQSAQCNNWLNPLMGGEVCQSTLTSYAEALSKASLAVPDSCK